MLYVFLNMDDPGLFHICHVAAVNDTGLVYMPYCCGIDDGHFKYIGMKKQHGYTQLWMAQ